MLTTVVSPSGVWLWAQAKARLFTVGRDAQASEVSIEIPTAPIQVVPKFKYLGCMFNADNTLMLGLSTEALHGPT